MTAVDLAGVTGGAGIYRSVVNNVTAVIGGWKLAHSMYEQPSFAEDWRARGAIKQYLDGSDKLPSWATWRK